MRALRKQYLALWLQMQEEPKLSKRLLIAKRALVIYRKIAELAK